MGTKYEKIVLQSKYIKKDEKRQVLRHAKIYTECRKKFPKVSKFLESSLNVPLAIGKSLYKSNEKYKHKFWEWALGQAEVRNEIRLKLNKLVEKELEELLEIEIVDTDKIIGNDYKEKVRNVIQLPKE